MTPPICHVQMMEIGQLPPLQLPAWTSHIRSLMLQGIINVSKELCVSVKLPARLIYRCPRCGRRCVERQDKATLRGDSSYLGA